MTYRPEPLTYRQILGWADDWYAKAKRWPIKASGQIPYTLGLKWTTVDAALRSGARSLPGGLSLARLLAQYRGVRNRKALPRLTVRQILTWADTWFQANGRWPTKTSGRIRDSGGETWAAIHAALWAGGRGLPGGITLAQLLTSKRNVRNRMQLPPLSLKRILEWCDQFHARTGRWPPGGEAQIAGTAGETWGGIDQALRTGHRGLPGGDSLGNLLARRRRQLRRGTRPPLSEAQIVRLAEAHHRRIGEWPNYRSGPVPEAQGEEWLALDIALRSGFRGLRPRSSLARLLHERCGVRNAGQLPDLTEAQVLKWAQTFFKRVGRFPRTTDGPISGSDGETWRRLSEAMEKGRR